MAEGRSLVLVSEQPATAGAVSSALGNGRLSEQDVCRDLQQLAQRLESSSASAALVDIDARPRAMLAELEPVVRRFPETRFIVLSSSLDNELVLEAMQVGARHFMVKQSIAATLVPVLQRLLAGTPGQRQEHYGQTVTVLSASGGSGATTVAVNLAQELVQAKATPVLLVDLDFSYGAVGSYLGLEAEHGVLELLERPGIIDAELVRTTATPVSQELLALPSAASARLGASGPATYSRLDEVLGGSRRWARWTVIDAPRVPIDVAEQLAAGSAATLLLFQLTVKDVRMARAMLTALTARGVAAETIVPVVNRYYRRRLMVELEEARRALDVSKIECIGSDFQAVSRSINYGKPLNATAPRSAVRREIQQIAERILDASLTRPGAGH